MKKYRKCVALLVVAILCLGTASVALAYHDSSTGRVRFEAGNVYNAFGVLVISGNFVNQSPWDVQINETTLYLTLNGRTVPKQEFDLLSSEVKVNKGGRRSFTFKLTNTKLGLERISSWRVFSELEYDKVRKTNEED